MGQIRHALLRHWLDACKVNHLMRSTSAQSGQPAMKALQDELKVAVCDLLGCGITAAAWDQATLPIGEAELGIKDPLTIWPAARTAALANFQLKARAVGVPQELTTTIAPDLGVTLQGLALAVGPHNEAANRWLNDPPSFVQADKKAAMQSSWGEAITKIRKDRLKHSGTARDQVRHSFQIGPLATGWLSLTPSRQTNTTLPDADFRSLCRYWLGLPLLPDGTTYQCPLCQGSVDPHGDHLVTCTRNGLTQRHNALRDELSRILTASGVAHQKEVHALGRDRPLQTCSWYLGTRAETCA